MGSNNRVGGHGGSTSTSVKMQTYFFRFVMHLYCTTLVNCLVLLHHFCQCFFRVHQGWIKWFLLQEQEFQIKTLLHIQSTSLYQCDNFFNVPCQFPWRGAPRSSTLSTQGKIAFFQNHAICIQRRPLYLSLVTGERYLICCFHLQPFVNSRHLQTLCGSVFVNRLSVVSLCNQSTLCNQISFPLMDDLHWNARI